MEGQKKRDRDEEASRIPGDHFEEPPEAIIQFADYTDECRPVPDNNPFWTNGHNPLSSKGN